ncbi:OmpA family protein [Xinfangfangia sp. CPCC 101601]|uniref:OmpA family protein n=1 Tax=Pseudogemmobacter lacusdianii TaxID=3069608 RepID=A0ABU0VWH1_9RHOB|nr:OmpA family protein [Xinfangfangia sp. CPCC 101601]MDQ2066063.1 OmpA family protein [Xinfangfangia sp. CPCC 101601]
MSFYSRAARMLVAGLVLCFGMAGATASFADENAVVTGKIEWGVWIDDDGCMHWWADGGLEGYMVPRRNPKTGKPVCLKKNTCLVENTDTLFATDSHKLTASGRDRLRKFFSSAGAFGYAIYGHTDSRASDEYNMALSKRRAHSVAEVARSVGASVERELGFGERQPIASNQTVAGMAKNRRVEIICYRW